MLFSGERTEEILAIDEALTRLQERDARIGKIGDYRFFEGSLWGRPPKPSQLSPAPPRCGWDAAQGWLFKEVKPVNHPQQGTS